MIMPCWNGWSTSFFLGILIVVFALPNPAASADEGTAEDVPSELVDYVNRPEDVFRWQLRQKLDTDQGTVYDLDLTSQKWQGIVWKHPLQVFEPADVRYPQHVLLFVTGGSNGKRPGKGDMERGLRLAQMTGARVAVLTQVPNQPLFGGRVEDDLITETWLRYLETGDANWPLLFPMVKSAVKAMDAVEALAADQWKGSVEGFVITGASKRGWTSWLTPVADKRVVATAPIVIDVLNFQPQMRHQLDTWGTYSVQIHDYTSKGLINLEDETAREVALRRMMDPYTYRQRLSLPKLLVNGTNDPYWVVDAMRFYWDDLVGPKYILQVPNAGHGLEGGRELAYATLAAYFRHVAGSKPMPELEWTHDETTDTLEIRVRSSVPPKAARAWIARSDIKDFRGAQWAPESMTLQNGVWVGSAARPKTGHVALYGELQFEHEGLLYSLCTLVHRE